jgi:hypothetical protein
MLDCCTNLEEVKQKGITLDDFVCLARCQGVTVDAVRAPALVEDFPKDTSTDVFHAEDSAPGRYAACIPKHSVLTGVSNTDATSGGL